MSVLKWIKLIGFISLIVQYSQADKTHKRLVRHHYFEYIYIGV